MEEEKEDPDELRKTYENQGEEPKEQMKEESAGPSKRKLSRRSDEYQRGRKCIKSNAIDVKDTCPKRLRTTGDEEQGDSEKAKMSSSKKLDLQTEKRSGQTEHQSQGQSYSGESNKVNKLEWQKMAKTTFSSKGPDQKQPKTAQTPSPRKSGLKLSRDSDQDETKMAKIDSEKQDKPKSNNEEKGEINRLEQMNEPSSDYSVAGGSRQTVDDSTTSFSQSLTDYQFQKLLGRGSFGKVMLSSYKSTNQLVAIKTICKARMKETSIQMEQRILQVARGSPFLCHGLTTFHTSENTYLVMEFIRGGSLFSFMAGKGSLHETVSRFIAAELVCGIQFLHSHGIIHRDLKPENILLTHDGHVKIADFGLAAENIFDSNKVDSPYGTLQYMAPEVLCNVPYGASADWWSFGVILYQMITGQHPFEEDDLNRMLCRVVISDPCYPDWMGSDPMDLLKKLLVKDADSRLGVSGRIREHVFFGDTDWKELESGKVCPPFQMLTK